MIPAVVLGVLSGFAVVRFFSRARHGGGCGAHAGCGAACGGGFGRRPRVLYWLSRRLDLDARQQEEVQGLMQRVFQAASQLRAGKREGLAAVAEAFGGQTFDRARVEAAAARQGQALSGVSKEVVDALARLHEILTPGQRERLLAMVGHRFGWSF